MATSKTAKKNAAFAVAPHPSGQTRARLNGKGSTVPTAPVQLASNRNVLAIVDQPGKSRELQMAESYLGFAGTNAAVAQRFASHGGQNENAIGITETVQVMRSAAAAVKANDMSDMEAMLVAQTMSLNAIYAELAQRASRNLGTNLEAAERYMRLALKTQAQSRANIEALGALKSPPVVFAKQANFASGHPQVNNSAAAPVHRGSRAGTADSAQSKLLEASDVERLDTGAKGSAGRTDQDLATVGALHGTKQRSG